MLRHCETPEFSRSFVDCAMYLQQYFDTTEEVNHEDLKCQI